VARNTTSTSTPFVLGLRKVIATKGFSKGLESRKS
jgi:hypothetical protein